MLTKRPILYSVLIHTVALVSSFFYWRQDLSIPSTPSISPPSTQSVSLLSKTNPAPKIRNEGHKDRNKEKTNSSSQSSQPSEKSTSETPTATGATSAPIPIHIIVDKIQAELEYPLSLRRRGISGDVLIDLSLDSVGNPTARSIIQSSGSEELDQLALQAIDRAAPFSPAQSITVRVPISFKLK